MTAMLSPLPEHPIARSTRNRILLTRAPNGPPTPLRVIYDGTLASHQVKIDTTSGALTFFGTEGLKAGDKGDRLRCRKGPMPCG